MEGGGGGSCIAEAGSAHQQFRLSAHELSHAELSAFCIDAPIKDQLERASVQLEQMELQGFNMFVCIVLGIV